uniref:Translocase of inner mitochondrial membrane 44 n=1 Tax=Myotis myotis TaxID=51298 RepID=A0A7J7XM23_MYOMY|nr:translocase of inner mitochondrial membrane 44 [Myotis myotis]
MKMRYDESDNTLIRASRALTDKVTDLLGGLFSKTEMSEVLTEILRVDPAFDKERFLQQCENDIIPNVLEAMISGELDILKDWCYEALAMGKMMEQGPVLIVTFHAQLVMVIKNAKGEVVEGNPAHTHSHSCRTRCYACCTCGHCAGTRMSSTHMRPGGSWTSPLPVQSRSSELGSHDRRFQAVHRRAAAQGGNVHLWQ